MIAAPPKPTQRLTADAVAFVNSAPAGALVGLFGFRFAVVMLSVLHATAPAISASPVRPRSQVFVIDLSSVCGWGLWSDLQGESDASSRWHRCKFQSLGISSVVRELRVDIRDVRVGPEIPADQGEVHRVRVEALRKTRRQVIADPQFAELDVAVIVRVRLIDQPERLEVLL